MEEQKNKNQLNIELTDDVAEGIYSNLAMITHSNSEFVTDFIQIMPGVPKARVRSRILMTPQHAKRLMKALAGNIQKYESLHGEIKDIEDPKQPIPMNFGGHVGEA